MTTVTLVIISDNGNEIFENFNGVAPRKGESVVFYKKKHDGCQYTGIVTNVHHRISYEVQNDMRRNNVIQEIEVTITEMRVMRC